MYTGRTTYREYLYEYCEKDWDRWNAEQRRNRVATDRARARKKALEEARDRRVFPPYRRVKG